MVENINETFIVRHWFKDEEKYIVNNLPMEYPDYITGDTYIDALYAALCAVCEAKGGAS